MGSIRTNPIRIKLSAIKIPEFFNANQPRPETMARKRAQIENDGYASGIVLAKGCWLVDGYATYLAAREAGLHCACCRFDLSFSPNPVYKRPVIHSTALFGPGCANIRMNIGKAAKCRPGQVFLAICLKKKHVKFFYATGLAVNPVSWNQDEYMTVMLPFRKKV